jgi:hypothetical protein
MTVPLHDLLEHVLDGEPELGDDVDAVFRRADRLVRQRSRLMVAGAGVAVVGIALGGYLLATSLVSADGPAAPAAVAPAVVAPAVRSLPAPAPSKIVPSAVADPVLAVIAPVIDGKGLRIVPRPPERGAGWRQYSVFDAAGKPRGTVVAAVYATPGELCFPVLADDGVCARTERTDGDVEYLRYDDDQDVEWQVHETIARHQGRTIAVMATGERDTKEAKNGRPPLTGTQTRRIATTAALAAAFGPGEQCNGPAAGACPVFRVPVPTAD